MPNERVIFVTGVAGDWGNRAAAKLLEQEDVHVISIDNEPPHEKGGYGEYKCY